jgi:MFS transporter, DHA2 family, multidrug resistance protein
MNAKYAANKWLVVIPIMLATVMQALDTTIANVALPHMQGSLNATQDQITWVLTSYIVAAAIMTPPTGFLGNQLGRKKLFLICVGGFTIASILCGAAQSLPEMVLFRLLQGVFGAGLVPLSQAVLLDTFPVEQHGQAMALWGVGVMLGPILGPTLGGWLTEYYNWRWVFYINVPVGIVAILGILAFMPGGSQGNKRPFDFFGFVLLSVAIGGLQLMLDRGQTKDWFSSPEIIAEAVACGLCLYMFLVHIFTADHPFVEPKLFTDRNYVTALMFMFMIGVLILAVMALMPPFLQGLMDYPALTTGLVLAPRGIGTMVAMMIVGKLIGKVDVRLLILFGQSVVAFSLWQMTQFNLDVTNRMLVNTGLIQGVGMGFVFVPLSTIAYATLEPRMRNEATAFFSLIRNIGSSIGVSVVTALLARNTQINHASLAAHISRFSPAVETARATAAGSGLPQHDVGAVIGILNGMVTRQAAAIAYLDDFRLIMYVTLAALPLLLIMKIPKRAVTTLNPAEALE